MGKQEMTDGRKMRKKKEKRISFLRLVPFLTLRLVLKPQLELVERTGWRLRGRKPQVFPFP